MGASSVGDRAALADDAFADDTLADAAFAEDTFAVAAFADETFADTAFRAHFSLNLWLSPALNVKP
jgi:hypothetical protein